MGSSLHFAVGVDLATTDKQRSQGSASRSLGGRDDIQSLSNSKRRWIPPSSLRRDAHNPNENADRTFRKVRGILNKITPDRFNKLSSDILNVGLNSPFLLKGVILLIFEKALDEPKYCSMYAQLCRKLSEEAPNFDNQDGPCTFNRHLLSKCQEEFERRRRASEMWERANEHGLSPEEEEQRMAARRKMVGNLRFIGELGKLEIIAESILHKCIQQLLEKKRQRTVVDLAEDLECLCQMMRTCGKVLDKPKAKYLMDQYFERMTQLTVNQELPSRIRFMLQDSLDLRFANWVPRKIAQIDGPKTIQQVREEAARDLGVYIPPPNMHGHHKHSGPISPLSVMPSFFPSGTGSRTGMEDVFGFSPLGNVTLGTGPGVISSQPDKFFETNGYANNGVNREQTFRPRQQPGQNFTMNNYYQNKTFNPQNYNRQNNQNNQQNNYSNAANKELPPRFMKMLSQNRTPANSGGGDELSLRPISSMMLKPKTPGLLPASAQMPSQPAQEQLAIPQPPNQKPPVPLMHKEPPIVIKQVSGDKFKSNKKDKGPNREEHLRRLKDVLESFFNGQEVSEAVNCYRELKIPERFVANAAHTILQSILRKDESTMELGVLFLKRLRSENALNIEKLNEGIKQIFDHLEDMVSECPRVRSNLALVLASFISDRMLTLAEVLEPLEGGVHFPLFVLILQAVHKLLGKSELLSLYDDSKINLMSLLSEKSRTKEKLADVLEANQLVFMCPLLRIQSDLWKAVSVDPSPQVFYKYIKDNLAAEHHTDPSFISALLTVLVKYIAQETTMSSESDANAVPEMAIVEQEKEMLSRYKPILQAFLHDHVKLQVIAIYALQVFTDTHNFPKGMLLRWFVNMYDLEIIEEEAFLMWKEDLSQDYPGKGKALFQVNQWLTWLEETEEDEEEEEEEEEIQ